jgi:hypothetical protein
MFEVESSRVGAAAARPLSTVRCYAAMLPVHYAAAPLMHPYLRPPWTMSVRGVVPKLTGDQEVGDSNPPSCTSKLLFHCVF